MTSRKLLWIPALCAYVALTCASDVTVADDTEIYSGTDEVVGTVAPNVLLLLDTSGSMIKNNVITSITTVVKAAEEYNPARYYQVPSKDKNGETSSLAEHCPNDRLYRVEGDDTAALEPIDACGDSGENWLPVDKFHCQAAVSDLNTKGYYTGRFSEYRGYLSNPRWDNPNQSNIAKSSAELWYECEDDAGVHARASSTPKFVDHRSVDGGGVYEKTADDEYKINTGETIALELEVSDDDVTDDRRFVATGGANDYPDHHPYTKDPALAFQWQSDWDTDSSVSDVGDVTADYDYHITIYHPNYLRYLFGWKDMSDESTYDNDSYDSGEGYNEEITNTTTTDHGTRLDVLKSVMTELLDEWEDVNVGIMRYNIQSGSRTLYPISKIEDHRTELKQIVDDLTAGDATPHAEALYEAYNYYRGNYVEFGDAHSNVSVASTRHPSNSSKYRTPIAYGCQANTIIHMTDGRPTRDGGTESSGDPVIHYMSGATELTTDDVDTAIKALPKFSSLPSGDTSCEVISEDNERDGVTPDNCMDELAEYMANNRPTVDILDTDGSVKSAGVSAEPINTYTIGFALDMPYLEDTANKGKGQYYTANDVDALKNAFASMVDRIKNVGTRVVSPPGVAVEAFSRSMHLNELYFNLFQPEEKALFPGNLKRYELALNSSGEVIIVDEDEDPALDTVNGGFLNSAKSWWSNTADGNYVERGGMLDNLPLPRTVYTYIPSASTTLTDAANRFEVGNTSIGTGAGQLDLPADEVGERDDVIKWALGYDAFDDDEDGIKTEAHGKMGDPLHSRPTLVVYDGDKDSTIEVNDPDMQVITLTNDGFLRAVDTETGIEQWSFIPMETWHVLNKARKNTQSTKLYGLDGFITPWSYDANGNGVIESGDWTRIYFGMRRGGRHYYALDLSTKNSPKYMWQIDGGSGNFATLGQTWPQMQRALIDVGGTQTRALIFTGGYDTAYDSATTTMPNATMGNDIFIIKESDGSLIWRAGMVSAVDDVEQDKMNYAFPAEPVVIDMDNDGLHDRIYAVDIAGQLWRFDIQNGSASDELVLGSVFASLSTAGGDENRKFYNQPDIAILEDASNQIVRVNVGSGHRAKPLNSTINDYFYSVADPYTIGTNSVSALINDVSKYDATVITPAVLTNATTISKGGSAGDYGWKLAMTAGSPAKGEKVLAPSITVDNEVLFTTYEPPTEIGVDNCVINIGTSRVYSVALGNARPKTDTNDDGTIDDDITGADDTGDSRFVESDYAGIPPSVVVLFPEAADGAPVGCVGPQCKKLGFDNKLRRSYWYTPNRDPAN